MGLLNKIIHQVKGTSLAKYQKIVNTINDLEPKFERLSSAELTVQTKIFKERFQNGESLENMLPDVFAVMREAAKRTIGQRHFDVQLIGGVVLHEGKIAEMKTGEGKTLVATLPLYLNAISGKGVHLVTVNDFLAKFQGQWMGSVYHTLGMTTGIIGHEQSYLYTPVTQNVDDITWKHLIPVSRQEAYRADITYGTNNEFGFDYLRDNMVASKEQLTQRMQNFAIVDEVDSILIDEARTPLIISAPARESTSLYQQFADLVKRLKPEDYTLDEKDKAVSLTDPGIKKIEGWLNIANLYDPNNVTLIHHGEEALKAQLLFNKDRDYVIKDGEIIIVDEFTGRLMHGRRYSEGLHQAIEAKEGVEVKRESETLATISFQNLFRLYKKLAGMTGTATTESEEFWKIYGLEVVPIPTNQPMVRNDRNDKIYKNQQAKLKAVVEEIKTRNANGQPVLVGTITISKNEELSKLLKKEGVKHQVLNAKKHEQEAKVIAEAGRKGSVTLATNIAGRGVDIILGGVAPEQSQISNPVPTGRQVKSQNISNQEEEIGLEVLTHNTRTIKDWEKEHSEVVALGGLCVIGTERHEARRIDNQLRGRAGRQGDPGESVFFVSMDDDLMRIFGGDRIKGMMDRLGLPDDTPIEHGLVSRSIEQSQKKVEGHNFDIRKHLVEYDDVMNKQREAIYRKRRLILDNKGRLDEEVVDLHSEIISMVSDEELPILREKVNKFGLDNFRNVEQQIYLRVIDQFWIDHLNSMEELRTGIGLRGYGQQDPLIEYKHEAFRMFERLLDAIDAQVIEILLKIEAVKSASVSSSQVETIEQGATEEESGEIFKEDKEELQSSALGLPRGNFANANGISAGVNITVRKKGQILEQSSTFGGQVAKVGRNDPCPCGGGKKYKKCHGR